MPTGTGRRWFGLCRWVCKTQPGSVTGQTLPVGNWIIFFRSETRITRSFLVMVVQKWHSFSSCYVISWLVNPRKFDWFPHKYPSEADFYHKPVLTDCSSTGKPDCKNLWRRDALLHSRRVALVLKWDVVDKKDSSDRRLVFALPMVTKPPLRFFLFISVFQSSHTYSLH